MQSNKHDPADRIHTPDSKPEERTSGIPLNESTMRRLDNLTPWRIDPASIKFPNDPFRFNGGYATVVRGLLGFSTEDTRDQVGESSSENAKPNDCTAKLEGESERRDAKANSNLTRQNEEPGPEGQDRRSGGKRQPKSVAVKKMRFKTPNDDEALQVLSLTLKEAEFLVELWHENVTELEGFVEDVSKRMIWLVFPWAENGTLREFITSADLEIPERISLIFDVARGLEYLHHREAPICHGDLKSVNILVNSKFRAMITDFGSAHYSVVKSPNEETERAQRESQHTVPVEATFCPSTNTIILTGVHYTTRWASPELLETNEPSLASDIWAFGWVAYEVMTGSVPFHDDVQEAVVIKRVSEGDLPSISNDARMLLIQALCSLVQQCWSIEPNNRPKAEECRKALSWMPMVTPNPQRAKDAADFANRSPELLMKLGHMHRQQSDYPMASEYYTRALGVYADIGDRKGKANALKFLANAYLLQDMTDHAFKLYSECLQIWTEIGEKGGRADALWGLAAVHRARYKYSQAFALYSECLEIRTDIGDRPGRCDPLRGLAEIHRLRKEYDQALELYSECLKIRTEIGDRRGRASALWGLAEIRRLRGDYPQAFAFYSECIHIYTDLGHKGRKADALGGLAQTHLARKEYTQAVKSYSECLPIFTDIGDRDAKAIASWGLARAHLMEGRYSRAISLYFNALKLGSINNIGIIQYWRASLARIETKSPQSRNMSSEKLKAL